MSKVTEPKPSTAKAKLEAVADLEAAVEAAAPSAPALTPAAPGARRFGWMHPQLEELLGAKRKIAIVGFTPSREAAPWGHPEWQTWVCNNLWKFCPKADVIFDLHGDTVFDDDYAKADPDHLAFCKSGEKPLVVFRPRPEWPSSLPFPHEQMLRDYPPYFTNTISWQIALAIRLLTVGIEYDTPEGRQSRIVALPGAELMIAGVDMAQDEEHVRQRPSCEVFIGMAIGAGINVVIPEDSDLLKTAVQYGLEDMSALQHKMEVRIRELARRREQMQHQLAQMDQQRAELISQINQIIGAEGDTNYYRAVWMMPGINRDGSLKEAG